MSTKRNIIDVEFINNWLKLFYNICNTENKQLVATEINNLTSSNSVSASTFNTIMQILDQSEGVNKLNIFYMTIRMEKYFGLLSWLNQNDKSRWDELLYRANRLAKIDRDTVNMDMYKVVRKMYKIKRDTSIKYY